MYVACVDCQKRSPGIEVIKARESVNVQSRLRILQGRAQQLRMRILG